MAGAQLHAAQTGADGGWDETTTYTSNRISIVGYPCTIHPLDLALGITSIDALGDWYNSFLQPVNSLPSSQAGAQVLADRFDCRLLLDTFIPHGTDHPGYDDPRMYPGDEDEDNTTLDGLQEERWYDLMLCEEERRQAEQAKEARGHGPRGVRGQGGAERGIGNEYAFQYQDSDTMHTLPGPDRESSGSVTDRTQVAAPSHLTRPSTWRQYVVMDRCAFFIASQAPGGIARQYNDKNQQQPSGDNTQSLPSVQSITPVETAMRQYIARAHGYLDFLHSTHPLHAYFRCQVKIARATGQHVAYAPPDSASDGVAVDQDIDVLDQAFRVLVIMTRTAQLERRYGEGAVSHLRACGDPRLHFLSPWDDLFPCYQLVREHVLQSNTATGT